MLGIGGVVIGQAGIPSLKQRPQRAVEGAGASLQQQVRAARRPLHLLTLGKALADHGIHRGLGQARGDTLAGAKPLAIIDQAAPVARDVDREFADRPGEFAAKRIIRRLYT